MYWFSREERAEKRPVWSEYGLVVLELTLMMAVRILWERCY